MRPWVVVHQLRDSSERFEKRETFLLQIERTGFFLTFPRVDKDHRIEGNKEYLVNILYSSTCHQDPRLFAALTRRERSRIISSREGSCLTSYYITHVTHERCCKRTSVGNWNWGIHYCIIVIESVFRIIQC